MSIAARHLETRRPRKDRDVTWGRRCHDDRIEWVFWRRDRHRAIHALSHVFSSVELESVPCGFVAIVLRDCKRRLRDSVDEIDLALMERL